MLTKMTAARPEMSLSRLLDAFEQELIDASDEEIMAAAADLGMNPAMRGSAAFAGVKYPTNPRYADFFYGIEPWLGAQPDGERVAWEAGKRLKRKLSEPPP